MFKFDVLELSENLEVTKTKEKQYNGLGQNLLSNWVRGEKSRYDLVVPKLTSSLNVVQKGTSKIHKDYIGFLLWNSNAPRENNTKVSLFTSMYSTGQGMSVTPGNLWNIVVAYSARKIIKSDWLNWYDEYLAPNEEHEQFEQFKYDSMVYSLFESKSNQSSLRQITYKDKLWDIKNEFFWMSKDRMKELADDNGYDNLHRDARTSSDRHVYNLLFGEERIYDKLSDDAKVVLDKATELVEQSLQMRQVMADDHNHLDSWDAGYAQLKLVWKEYFEEDFKEFRQLYKNLEDRMRPLVYELGFLMK
jgi:hypothetical protein